MSLPDHNPFATRFIRPGALTYLFSPDESAESLVERLRQNGWRGEIIGPHGSGKSSLLAKLIPQLTAAGRTVVHYGLHQGERSLPVSRADVARWNEKTQVIVDGYEQLSWWSRRKLLSLVNSRQTGLLITAHQPMGLPTLLSTRPTLALARQIVSRLLPAGDMTLNENDIAAAFAMHPTNLREVLFALYDVYQQRRLAQRENVDETSTQ